jgi:putative oxidoreductase
MDRMTDAAFLVLRVTAGGLLAGHGAQKLFGMFEGHGFRGTAGWLESLGLRPGHLWALAAGLSEFGGGLLTAFGAADPIGPLGIVGAMGMATVKVHAGKPVWVTSGGAELPLTNMAIAAALILAGPGKYSVDESLDMHLPRWTVVPGLVGVAAAIAAGALISAHEPQTPKAVGGAELQAGKQGDQAAAQAQRSNQQPAQQPV